ncbi:succinylglutamate desuccinylase/aspartoacylase family protein [Amphritea sp. 1_MG-2023]|uniref:succinylglutamate desuccinylase/aspartoacylase domain-containing protein n=1 Tax=Amphritea sp. 1_MG-2023 TaxID=3062670 RepID=UPI0026E31B29|nr:succinylglutamate desuccinylase/aspartoacylase family protein [Amphritea sp. 1_MG-2023]MDO6564719.1 succinylglutamate desuccinylase/aspartoacylase family protein [Amphritea sp. 1_MG-2023]
MTVPPCRFSIAASDAPIELLPRDLSDWRQGNSGIDYVHRLDSGRDGPELVIQALTHGNEICGANALLWLLEHQFRPTKGALTLIFANVEAYQTFDPQRPFASRCLDEDMNRIWLSERLYHPDTRETQRAVELLPYIENADSVLDLHSTTFAVAPMLIYPQTSTNRAFADRLQFPFPHLLYDVGNYHDGIMISEHQRHAEQGVSIVAECGQHFAESTSQQALAVALRFIAQHGMLDNAVEIPAWGYAADHQAGHYRIDRVLHAATEQFRFVAPVTGFEQYNKGELIALDDQTLIAAPFDNCTLIMPARVPVIGEEVVTLAERL